MFTAQSRIKGQITMARFRNRGRGWAGVIVALVVAIGASVLPSSPVSAGALLSVAPTFPTAVVVGQTGVAASISITNDNTAPDSSSTVCRHDDSQAGPFPECFGAGGILLTPSCAAQHPSFTICLPDGADPGVFQISPTGSGSEACDGVTFEAVPLNDAFGNYRFDPPPGVHVVLPAAGSVCTINFTFSVLRMPTLDRQPTVAGMQTAQIALASSQSNLGNLAAGQGSTTPVTVQQAVPLIATTASSGFDLGGGQLSDVADVSGLAGDPSGTTVTFRLYGPSDPTCAGVPVFTDTKPLIINVDSTSGTAQSASFTPTDAGTYRWVATYDGSVDNASVSGVCGDVTETSLIAQATPDIETVASPDAALGVGQLSDTATVSGRVNPVGAQTVTFELFGPSDSECAGPPVFSSTVALVGDVATSEAYVPIDVGIHRWIASYDGDANNESVSGGCDDVGETSEVTQATPEIVTVASDGVALGAGQLSDTATVSGRVNPVGAQTVTFELFGPSDSE